MTARPTSATSATPAAPTLRLRRRWDDLPERARTAVEGQVGEVATWTSAELGLTSGVAASITTTQGAVFFVKAAPAAAPIAPHYERERAANQALPPTIPAPRMLWADTIDDWHVLLFHHAPGRPADLGPTSRDLTPVVEAVSAIGMPCPWHEAPSAAGKAAGLIRGAGRLLDAPPAELATCAVLAKQLRPEHLAGDVLAHADLHADNLLVDHDTVNIVDWSLACTGAPWVDVALLLPRLIDAGHTPASAHETASRVPAWTMAPLDLADALCGLRALFATNMADTGPAHLAAKRRRTAAACRAWVEYRTR